MIVVPDGTPTYAGYVIEAMPDPYPDAPAEHILLRVGLGEEEELPAVYLELCSHKLSDFVIDLRFACAAARREGRPIIFGAGDRDDYSVGEIVRDE